MVRPKHALHVSAFAASALAGVLHPAGYESFLRKREDAPEDFDIYDLSNIKKIAAIGDSYSAGIGAGNRLGSLLSNQGAWACSRYDHAYPNLVNGNPSLGDPAGRKFQFESCSGALTHEIKDDQIPRIDDGQDVVLLSASGNDAGLVDILNQCVYQFFAPSNLLAWLASKTPEAIAVKELGGPDINKFARGCDGQMDDSEAMVDAPEFSQGITDLIKAALGKLNDGGTLYYTGYAKFWDQRATDDDWCSAPEHSWSIFLPNIPQGLDWQDVAVLSKDRRDRMNALVAKVNGKIKDAVTAAGDNAVFVDYDAYVGDLGGRFCGPGVEEPDTKRWNNNFYELDINDPMGTTPFKRTDSTAPDGTWEGDINHMAELTFTAGGTFKEDALIPSNNSDAVTERGTFIPDGYGRVFHPTVLGHQLISRLVIYDMAKRRGLANGIEFPDEADTVTDEDKCVLDGGDDSPGGDEPVDSQPKCDDKDQLSGIPYNVWSSSDNGAIWDKFCDAIDDQFTNFAQTVDTHGDEKEPTPSRFVKRTPPPNLNAYDSFNFALNWVPNKSQRQCSKSCKEAFQSMITSPCGHQGTGSISTAKAEMNVGCGTYSFEVSGPDLPPRQGPPKPSLSVQHCFGSDDFGDHGDIQPTWQAQYTGWACAGSALKTLKKDDPSTFVHWSTVTNGVPYQYNIVWEEGCETTVTEANVYQPIPASKANCMQMMQDNYKKCNNGGVGGWVVASCIRYEFKAQKKDG